MTRYAVRLGATLALVLAACTDPAKSVRPLVPNDVLSLDKKDSDDDTVLPIGRFLSEGDSERRACRSAPYKQFDFWRGRWDVTLPEGSDLVGTNEITDALDGCVLEEHWTQVGGYRGRSLNAYDAADGQWHQLWSEAGGASFALDGSGGRGFMTMSQNAPVNRFDPTPVIDRITWRSAGRNVVRQSGDQSVNGGPFVPSFDLAYRRVERVSPIAEVPTGFCSAPGRVRFHSFDFLVGAWRVHRIARGNKEGEQLNTRISKDVSDCLVEERMQGPDGYEAIAYSAFHVRLFRWNRMVVDNRGVRLFLSGPASLTGTDMTLTGQRIDARGVMTMVRVTWQQLSPDAIEQSWEFSIDGGATWNTPTVLTMTRRTASSANND